MRFTEEDDILTADEARDRSKLGLEDSKIREGIRAIMGDIKHLSYYGLRAINHTIRLKNDEEYKKIKEEVEKLGFKFKLKDTEKSSLPNFFNYIVDIQW